MEIKSDIPVPPAAGGRPRVYPFDKMAVGDSFDLPLAGYAAADGSDRVVSRVRSAAKNYARVTGTEFRVRTIREEGVCRCWRSK
jgi:hypothetical protein